MSFSNLPSEILFKVLKYLSYEEISNLRVVNKQFNTACSTCLNHGFRRAQSLQICTLRMIKNVLPKRESERRKHLMYPRHDALMGLDTRFSLLRMTYSRHIESGRCCFIPGMVLDELFNVLMKIKNNKELLPSIKLLQEVRDISSMAMEHFDEVVLPTLIRNKPGDFFLNLKDGTESDIQNGGATEESTTKSKLKLHSLKKQNIKLQRIMQLESLRRNKRIRVLEKRVQRQDQSLADCNSQMVEMWSQLQTLQSLLATYSLSPSDSSYSAASSLNVNRELKNVPRKRPNSTRQALAKKSKIK